MMDFQYPVRAEHAFPPPTDVDSLRAYSLPVQSLLAFLGGPREARGQRPRFARPGGGRPPSAAGRASHGGASLRSAWLNSARCFVHGEHIRGEVYQHWRQDMRESSEKLREAPRGTERLREAPRSSEIVLQSVIQNRSILLSNF